MVRCKICGEEIKDGDKIVVQYEGLMEYEQKEARPRRFDTLPRYWHKKCKPWHA
jgi:hypothetical protein